ncbi:MULTISPECIES: hypothetical protein [unclassified Endozoicomonas]
MQGGEPYFEVYFRVLSQLIDFYHDSWQRLLLVFFQTRDYKKAQLDA